MSASRKGREESEDDEIKPEMIEAGYSVLIYEYDPDDSEGHRRHVVKEMYTAMMLAKREGASRSRSTGTKIAN